ncbi:MAG: PilZ domain-containing protein [Magnetococcales bacterium]|nr:PilZ domain-containing protein [Magnetococcales bacterium]
MNHPPRDSSASSRRRHDRVEVRYQAILELANGRRISGATKNVSLAGLYFVPAGTLEDLEIGHLVKLRLTSLNDQVEYSCRVVHRDDRGAGLALDAMGSTGFGAALTLTLMQEIQIKIGVEVDPPDSVRVRRLDNIGSGGGYTPQPGRLLKVSANNLEFGYPATPGWECKMGDALKLELQPMRQESFPVEGRVRAVLSGDPRSREKNNERVAVVLLLAQSDKSARNLRNLLQSLHARRLQQMVTTRSTALALQSGPDLPARTRPETRRDLERFYGFRRNSP